MKGRAPVLLVDMQGACTALATSRWHVWRMVSTGRLPVVRLPGARDRHSRGTTESSRRVLFAVEDLQKLINESKEQQPATSATSVVVAMKKKTKGAA